MGIVEHVRDRDSISTAGACAHMELDGDNIHERDYRETRSPSLIQKDTAYSIAPKFRALLVVKMHFRSA